MPKPKRPGPDWNQIADFYSAFTLCELDDTRAYFDAIGLDGADSVLDVCCGPGRASIAAAERGCAVTGIDSAERMLAHARENAAACGVGERCTFVLQDWGQVLPGQNVKVHDVVFAARCGAMMDVAKLSSLARKTVAVQIFADAPSIPALQGVLFSGCEAPEGPEDAPRPGRPPMPPAGGPGAPMPGPGMPPAGGPGMPGGPMGPGGPGMPPMPPAGGPGPMGPGGAGASGRKPSAYKELIDKVYNLGFDPNVRIMPERFRKTFATAAEANAWVCTLDPDRARGNEERVAANVAPLLRQTDAGVEFCIATAAAIVWWDVRGAAATNPWIMGIAE